MNNASTNEAVTNNEATNEPMVNEAPLRKSQRERKTVILDEFVTYMSKDVNDMGKVEDPTSYKEAIKGKNSSKWLDAMEDELKSMSSNKV